MLLCLAYLLHRDLSLWVLVTTHFISGSGYTNRIIIVLWHKNVIILVKLDLSTESTRIYSSTWFYITFYYCCIHMLYDIVFCKDFWILGLWGILSQLTNGLLIDKPWIILNVNKPLGRLLGRLFTDFLHLAVLTQILSKSLGSLEYFMRFYN